ncbi:MAG: N-acetylmuramoyl-L-alanine amidase, partial [Clostridium sp.]|nr:N-acetylmuramoyl-L-alanine amidase [Clostridium sp.]
MLLRKRNNIRSFFIVKILLFISLFIILGINITFACENDNSTKQTILIDPGHGGSDGGAKSKSGTNEKEINLSISLKLKNKLQDEGYKVYMTREDDTELKPNKKADLEARC